MGFFLVLCLITALVVAHGALIDKLSLNGFAGSQSPFADKLVDDTGKAFALSDLRPYWDLFSSRAFDISPDALHAIHKSTGKQYRIPVFRATVNNTIVQVVVDEGVSYAEIRRPGPSFDTFFVRDTTVSGDGDDDAVGEDEVEETLLVFGADDVNIDSSLRFGDAPPILEDGLSRHLFERDSNDRELLLGVCHIFRTVNIAIVYDSHWCGSYGTVVAAEARIMAIVASASIHYERDMCIKLQLTDIYGPDSTCGLESDTFGGFEFENACGGTTSLLSDFTEWSKNHRDEAMINRDAVIHFFTGRPPSSGTVGCAWTGVLCWLKYSYGIEYMTFNPNILAQGVVFAHELGHNLDARHLPDNSNDFNFIMEATLNSGSNGFSGASISRVLSFLDLPYITCDSEIPVEDDPTPAPTDVETAVPTMTPTNAPSVSPSTNRPTTIPSRAPSLFPTAVPTREPVENDCVETASSLCVVANKKNRFACFEVSDLFPLGCSKRLVLDSCNGMALRRRLGKRKKTASSKSIVEDADDTPNFGRADKNSFKAGNCKDQCIVVDNAICIGTNKKEAVRIAFEEIDRQGIGTGVFFTYVVTVADEKRSGCTEASIKCKD